MNRVTSEDAVRRAKAELDVPNSTPARVWHIRRLDRQGGYYLVELGDLGTAISIATVDDATGDMEQSAQLAGTRPHIVVDRDRALQLAGVKASTPAELVWKPCSATLSPIYPLWELKTKSGTVYVDQSGKLWPDLSPARPGSG